MDTLVVMGNKTEFEKGVWWLVDNLNFNKDKNVSLFETNIRVVGGNITNDSILVITIMILYSYRATISSFISFETRIESNYDSSV